MGALWDAKYGGKRKIKQPHESELWLKKYGARFLKDYDPNQPRDKRGRWAKVGGAAGERYSDFEELGRQHDNLTDIPSSRISALKRSEWGATYSRLSIKNDRDLYETDLVIRKDLLPTTSLEGFGVSKEEFAEIKDHALYLENKYGEPFDLNFTSPPDGADFDGWVMGGVDGTGNMTININREFFLNSRNERSDKQFKDEKKDFPEAGNRRLHFALNGAKREANALLFEEHFDLENFVKENPDYADAVRFTVRAKSPLDRIEKLKTVITHEYGHVVHLTSGLRRKNEIDAIVGPMSKSRRWLISDYAQTNNNETWAEAFAMYENHPHLAEQVLPGPLIGYIKSLHGG